MALWHLEGSIDETGTVKKIPITHFPFIIGRNKSIDMVVLRSGISREHAEIFSKDGRLFIRDLQSTNGTFVNKQRITSEALLTHNTVIHFAQFDFKLIDSEFKSSDEMLTVVMNLDDVPGLHNKSSKKQSRSSSISTAEKISKAKYLSNEKSEEKVNAPEVDAIKKRASPATNAESTPQKGHVRPNYHGDEKVFIQGQWGDSNRRTYPRREARWPALVTLKNQQPIQCTTKELSTSGLALKSPVNFQEQTLIKVNINAFYKGRNQEIAALGIVKHSAITAGGFTVGIQIKYCTDSSSEFITRFANREI